VLPFQHVVDQHRDDVAGLDPVADLDPDFADGAADAGGDDTGLAGDKAADDGNGLPQGFGDNDVDADLSWRLGGGLGLFLLRRRRGGKRRQSHRRGNGGNENEPPSRNPAEAGSW